MLVLTSEVPLYLAYEKQGSGQLTSAGAVVPAALPARIKLLPEAHPTHELSLPRS